MTAPRPIVPGRTYLVTRRCTQRQFLLRPDRQVEAIYLYCLAEAAQRFDVTLYGWMAMSNHQHLVVRDNLGNLPEFAAHLNKMLAKALNAKWTRRENLWATEQPSFVHLVDAADRFDKLIYLLANPVAGDLVEHAADWPGASSLSFHLNGRAREIERPRGFFRTDGPMPETVSLHVDRLEGFEHLTDAEWQDHLLKAVRAAEVTARAARVAGKRSVIGRKQVLRASPTDQPETLEARRHVRPQVACKDGRRRAEELGILRGFRTAHRAALREWHAGDRNVAFPFGTYRMRRLGARCETAVSTVPLERVAGSGGGRSGVALGAGSEPS